MARPAVPLPSIRDIFPEMSIPSNPLHSTQTPRTPSANYPEPLTTHPISPTCGRPANSPDARHPNAAISFQYPQAPPSSPSISPNDVAARPSQLLEPHSLPSPRHMNPPKCPPSYSFNVLRADPVTASLEHVASSTTLRHRGVTSNSPTAQTGAGITNGSAPAFRVAMAPMDQRPSQRHKLPVQPIIRSTRNPSSPTTFRDSDLPLHMRSNHSSVLSFSVSDPPSSASTIMSHDGRRSYLRSAEIMTTPLSGEGRGKKHQCPHCGKRFNRPSSMKIHVNTHTGAKPYRCPFPGCGREFNVNSNMRRHWRNHSRSGTGVLSDGGDIPFDAYPHTTAYQTGQPRMLQGGLGSHPPLMSPPATNSSLSDSEEDDEEGYSEDEGSPPGTDADGDVVMGGLGRRRHSIAGEARFSVSGTPNWKRPISSEAAPVSTRAAHGPSPHPSAAHAKTPPHSSTHAPHESPGSQSEFIYKPSLPAYALSCTDTRVSTVLRPAFTQNVGRWAIPTDTRVRGG
ncbi:hypothetical protein BKA83DRAFT_4176802 [Pisolithus microcarpus]|nr:hypothetical protein BKA83DRAFT_4176802 [Pisolithus microcarpus]